MREQAPLGRMGVDMTGAGHEGASEANESEEIMG